MKQRLLIGDPPVVFLRVSMGIMSTRRNRPEKLPPQPRIGDTSLEATNSCLYVALEEECCTSIMGARNTSTGKRGSFELRFFL